MTKSGVSWKICISKLCYFGGITKFFGFGNVFRPLYRTGSLCFFLVFISFLENSVQFVVSVEVLSAIRPILEKGFIRNDANNTLFKSHIDSRSETDGAEQRFLSCDPTLYVTWKSLNSAGEVRKSKSESAESALNNFDSL